MNRRDRLLFHHPRLDEAIRLWIGMTIAAGLYAALTALLGL